MKTNLFGYGQFPQRFSASRPKAVVSPQRLHHPPEIAIVDEVDAKDQDVNGDGIGDISHADVMERIIKGYCPSAHVTKFYFDKFPSHTPEEAFNHIAESGIQYDTVCFSYGSPRIYKTISGKKAVTPGTLAFFRNAMVHYLNPGNGEYFEMTGRAVAAIQRLIKLGMPVYIAAGNDGEETFNQYSLVHGATHVGATNALGQREAYSCDNSLVNRWEQGTYPVTKVKGGYDITGHGKPEVLDSEVSHRANIPKQFIGKPIDDVLASDKVLYQAYDDLVHGVRKRYDQYLFSIDKLVGFGFYDENQGKCMKAVGDYVFMDVPRARVLNGFRAQDGKIVYDPDGTGKANVVSVLYGTSFANPKAAALDLQDRLAHEQPESAEPQIDSLP